MSDATWMNGKRFGSFSFRFKLQINFVKRLTGLTGLTSTASFEFLIEQGFFDKFFENFSVLMQNFDKSYKSFTNLEEYVNEYSYNLNISVKSFTFLFFVYILLNSLVLLLFGLLAIRKSLRIWASSCYWSTRKRCQRLSAVQLASCTPPPFRYRWKGRPRCQMAACAPLHFRYRCVYY